MITLITLAGLIISAVVFLNFLSAEDNIKRGGKNLKSSDDLSENESQPNKDKIKRMLNQNPAHPRICPVCGSFLTKEEYLIAALEPEKQDGSVRQAHIYGCPHCYATDGVDLKLSGKEKIRT